MTKFKINDRVIDKNCNINAMIDTDIILPVVLDKNYNITNNKFIYSINEKLYTLDSSMIIDDHKKAIDYSNCDLKKKYAFPMKKYIISQEHAYGLMCDINYSKIVAIDYDNISYRLVDFEFNYLLKKSQVEAVDLILSSKGCYHIIAGLSNPCNIENFIRFESPNICEGYRTISLNRGHTVIRISQKFKRTTQHDLPIYLKSFRKIDGKEILINHEDDYVESDLNIVNKKPKSKIIKMRK